MRREVVIPQIAWLDFHKSSWHLITGNAYDPKRKWMIRDAALSDLTAEGWTIDGPHEMEPTIEHNTDRHLYGYADTAEES
jgi:hypothetical protein